ncbi:hypothetical protein ARMGADRAFT_1022721 [Armillaria gallica]|uniref:Uncharacterized protein n=1 Tax=Armillaria gallica TaxID=47427 RepID=A0A2H3F105_ARMGA|nr:hypothetical protein ARMGADRAFT_1022721 [Armillaria gallica]
MCWPSPASHCITVILDCCHLGGVSRGLSEPGVQMSSPMKWATLKDMLLTGDNKLRSYPGYQSILSKDWYPDMGSHIILVACKAHQFAKLKMVEGKDRVKGYIGIFMDSLVQVLWSSHCMRETMYADLVHYLDQTLHQMPVIAREHRDARIWYQE